MKQIAIPRSLTDPLPKPFAPHVVAAARRALSQGMSAPTHGIPGPNTTLVIPDDLFNAIAAVAPHRGGVAQYLAAAVMHTGVLPAVVVRSVTMPRREIKPQPVYTPPTPTYTKQQAAWWAEIHRRVALTKMDASFGRYAKLFITGGSPAVNMYRDDGDFFDEIQAGIVVRETLICDLDSDEMIAWRNGIVKATGKIIVWAYIDGECESLIVAREAEMRGRARMAGGAVADEVDRMEAAESLQTRMFGSRSDFLKLGGIELLRMGEAAPDHVLQLGQKAEGLKLISAPAKIMIDKSV